MHTTSAHHQTPTLGASSQPHGATPSRACASENGSVAMVNGPPPVRIAGLDAAELYMQVAAWGPAITDSGVDAAEAGDALGNADGTAE